MQSLDNAYARYLKSSIQVSISTEKMICRRPEKPAILISWLLLHMRGTQNEWSEWNA